MRSNGFNGLSGIYMKNENKMYSNLEFSIQLGAISQLAN